MLSEITINQNFPFQERYELLSETDDEFSFLWIIHQSAKGILQISLHFQENDSKTGLIRVDYNRGHKNPETVNSNVPEKFHPYVGKQFSNIEHNIHYHVQGYPSLAWAIPLTDDDFEIKSIDENDNNRSFANAITSFAKTIHIETIINVNTLLL
ncbi:MAG: hypothetical protein LBG96_12395 [Tannerella sp.]|nr:hypothetical protein [Tannerella sp.]